MYNIPLDNKIYSSSLVQDFLKGSEKLDPFINRGLQKDDIRMQMEKKKFSSEKRQILYSSLSRQYQESGMDTPEGVKNILEEKTYTVTTGHQLCLFGGPQYFIHKIVSAIKLSKDLKKQFPDNNFIPVFWMATEDHDFEEISSVQVFKKKIQIAGENAGAVGRISTTIFQSALQELKELFLNDRRADELLEIFEEAFKKDNWADATRYWVHQLFKEHDLLILDADDSQLKKLFIPVIQKEIEEGFSEKLIQSTSQELLKCGYSSQVNSRPINLFYLHSDNRLRIIPDEGHFRIGEEIYTKERLIEMVQEKPENFSPNVILRPLYQESVLPNLAYVGGPAEIAYWAQLKEVFNVVEVQFPKLILRNSFVWLSSNDLNWWKEQNLNEDDLFIHFDILVKKMLEHDDNENLSFKDENALLEELKEKLKLKISKEDASLEGMILSELKSLEKTILKIEKRLIKSKKEKRESYFNKVQKIQRSVMVGSSLNERIHNFIPLYCALQNEYIEKLLFHADPRSPSLKLLTY